MSSFVVFDIETDGLLDELTKLHCFCYAYADGDGGWTRGTITDPAEIPPFLEQFDYYVCHNLICYDLPAIQKLTGVEIDHTKGIDTLGLSWYLFPMKEVHGLKAWGEKLGIAKPEIESWTDLSQEEYIHRCTEDVSINLELFQKFMRKLTAIYGKDKESLKLLLEYITFKMYCLKLQQDSPLRLDVERTEQILARMEQLILEKADELKQVMPRVPKMATKNFPKRGLYKKDGNLSVHGKLWLDLVEEKGLPKDHREPISYISMYMEPNPNSSAQIKKWLFSFGWEPATFKYVREEDGSNRAIPQINDGKKLCDSITAMIEDHPELANLEGYSVLNSRASVLKGFLRDAVEKDGKYYLTAEAGGFTNTMRLKHRVLVNLPGVSGSNDYRDGQFIREVLCSDRGELCGADISSLEDSTKQHWIYPYDPEYVNEMQAADYDPHVAIGVTAKLISEDEAAWFKEYKELDNLSQDDKKKLKGLSNIRKKAKQTNFCLPVDNTDVLTPDGWKRYEQLSVGDWIYSMSTHTLELELTQIEQLPYFENVEVSVVGDDFWKFECTENHRWFAGMGRGFIETRDVSRYTSIITSAPYKNSGDDSLTTQQVRDLSWVLTGMRTQSFKEELWENLELGGTDTFDTDYTSIIQRMSFDQRREFLDILIKRQRVVRDKGKVLDGICFALTLNGHSYRLLTDGSLYIDSWGHMAGEKFENKLSTRTTNVFCVNNPNQTFIARQGGVVTITGNSSVYGVGAKKLALTIGCTIKEAEKLLKAYWKKNWAVKQFAEDMKRNVKHVGEEMWIRHPLNGLYYSLRYMKDIFSTLNQSSGVWVFDNWLMEILSRRPQLSGQFHDEIILDILLGRREQCDKLLSVCMDEVNRKLALNVTINYEAEYGPDYAAVH